MFSREAITQIQVLVIVALGFSLILGSVLGVFLWSHWRKPVLSHFNVERIPMNELQGGEGFSANGES